VDKVPVSSPNNLPSRLGSIQVPGHGLPIILLADRQTTGGYPKIATAISVDVYDLGQAKPGDRIRFSPISVIDAHEIRKRYEKRMKQCIEILNKSEYQMTKIDSAEPSTRAQAEGLVAGRNMFRKLEI
jgi:allophanate hydrolase subunit 2